MNLAQNRGLLFLVFIFAFILMGNFIHAKEIIKVKQKDWAEYFPNIPRHPSVYEPEFEEVDTSYITPHTKWAKPYYLGKIKVLVIAPRVCHRDTIELAQRLDIKFDTFCAYNWKQLGGAEPGECRSRTLVGFTQEEQLKRLNDLLNKKYDVIIIGKMFWNAFPEEVENKILNKVKNGTGLIISFCRNEKGFVPLILKKAASVEQAQKNLIAKGIPFTALSSWRYFKSNEDAANKIISLKEFGKGRIVILNVEGNSWNTFFVPPPLNKPEIRLWEIDYYFSLAAKAVLWAAGKSPIGNLDCIIKDNLAEIKVSGIRGPIKLNFKVRDGQGEVVYEKEGKENTFKLPELASGEYIADVILKKRGKSLNWYSTSFKVKRDLIIKSVEISPKIIKPDTKLTLTTALSSKAEGNIYLQIKLIDTFDRLIANINQKVLSGENTVKTEFVLKNPLSNLIKVNALLYTKKQRLSHCQTYIPVKLPYPRDDFGFICWGIFVNEYLWHYARKELYKLGVDSSYGSGTNWMQAWTTATTGFRIIPYMTRYTIRSTTKGPCHERMPCLSDPEYIESQQKRLRKKTEETSPFGPAAYSLGDENDLSLNDIEVCFSKNCKESFREYVKSIYKSLDVLNKEWGTSYNSWNEIEPIPLEEARRLHQPARWIDFRTHMENVFLNIHKIGKETVRSIDPDALVGFDGGFNITSFTGYDWWKLSRILDLWGVYPDHLQSEILRSFHRKEARTGRWYGGYNHLTRFTEYAHWEPWYVLFHEMNNIWWFNIILHSGGSCQAEDAMNPASFKPFPILKATSEEALKIKKGIGKLLLGCRRDSGGIAILYSQPSLHSATFYARYGDPNDSQYDFIRILEDLNYQYRFISCEQLKQGLLKKENYRLLILPRSIALSDGEKQEICSFVEQGGKVIADIKPGIYDEHGKLIEDLKWKSFLKDKVVVIDSKIRGYKKNNLESSAMRKFFSTKLKELKIKPEFLVIPNKGEIYEGELAIFTDKNIRYIGLLRDHSPKIKYQKAQIMLPDKSYVYNIRTKKYLGYINKISTNLKPGMAGLWAMLPEKAGELKLRIKQEASLGEEISYFITVKSSGSCVVRVEVFNPDGILQRHYCQNLTLNNGETDGTISLALNDKKGYWRIKVWDVASGVSDSKSFRVR